MNLMPARVLEASGGKSRLRLDASAAAQLQLGGQAVRAGDAVTVGVRPEALQIFADDRTLPAGLTALPAKVEAIERLGNITFAYLDGGTPEVITVQVTGPADFAPGQQVLVGMRAEGIHVFDSSGAAMAVAAVN
jgi:ABC-type sugar transport system ATPase subunit